MHIKKPTILLVDDHEENLFSLKNILDESSYDIMTALSAEAGWEILKEHKIACILLDVHMPNMNGFELAAKMRDDEELSAIPIIFVTAVEIGSEKSKKGYDLGALDYLIKPLNPNLVRTKVDLYCQLFQKDKTISRLQQRGYK